MVASALRLHTFEQECQCLYTSASQPHLGTASSHSWAAYPRFPAQLHLEARGVCVDPGATSERAEYETYRMGLLNPIQHDMILYLDGLASPVHIESRLQDLRSGPLVGSFWTVEIDTNSSWSKVLESQRACLGQ